MKLHKEFSSLKSSTKLALAGILQWLTTNERTQWGTDQMGRIPKFLTNGSCFTSLWQLVDHDVVNELTSGQAPVETQLINLLL